MITAQAVDIIQPDIAKAGGLLEAKKISDLAAGAPIEEVFAKYRRL